ncbi:His Kinase A (phospho-acceptor) domain-containing protein [Spirosomataceae bacterium TFI 002]|nr:His Kinase A (phospho-acceptor) domain-containing protein [Spirosomataceae bacterium TFI 002]
MVNNDSSKVTGDLKSQKEKSAAQLIKAKKELVFEHEEKEKRAAELIVANEELLFQNEEKEKRASELVIANKELVFQNIEKEKRASELVIANKELAFQNEEKEKRASELVIANKELQFQNEEKEKRASELAIANKELQFQNEEKEKRASELIIANAELAFQNEEKEKRASELIIANEELAYQNIEKEKRAAELMIANKELESFTYISSHDLQEPLRKIQLFANRLSADESHNLSEKGNGYVLRMNDAASRMQALITDLLAYSRTTTSERVFVTTNLNTIIDSVISDFREIIAEQNATINVVSDTVADIIPFQFRQLMYNIIGNALKFSKPDIAPHIIIKSAIINGSDIGSQQILSSAKYCHITISDNGIGFEPQYKDRIFELFKRLHDKETISGTGIGLTIVKKIVENHNGIITAHSDLNKGATFDIYIPSS